MFNAELHPRDYNYVYTHAPATHIGYVFINISLARLSVIITIRLARINVLCHLFIYIRPSSITPYIILFCEQVDVLHYSDIDPQPLSKR